MLDYEQQRKLIIVFILAVVLVVIIAIVALVFIWLPEKEEEYVFEVGIVNSVNVSEETVIKHYYEEISQMLLNKDTDAIYKLVGKDYLEYNKYTKQDIEKYIQDKNVLGSALELVTTETYAVPGYSNVYYLDIKVVDEVYSMGIVIREISPENYTIAFDKFIDYSTNVYNGVVNSVELDVYKMVRYTNSVEYGFRVTNNYDKDIVINNNSLANAIIWVNSQNQVKTPIMTTLATSQVKLASKSLNEFVVVYNISDVYDYYTYNTLVLKDVLYTGMQGTTDIQFNLLK